MFSFDSYHQGIYKTRCVNELVPYLIQLRCKVGNVWTDDIHNFFNENEVLAILLLGLLRIEAARGVVSVSLLDLWQLFAIMYHLFRNDHLAQSDALVERYCALPVHPGAIHRYPGDMHVYRDCVSF